MRRSSLLAFAYLAAVTAPASAQTSNAPPVAAKSTGGPDIVVTARKPVARKDVQTFVRSASAPVDGQLTRFTGDVCPFAVGFPAAASTVIVDRMRHIAESVGASLAKPGCKGNMVLIATDYGATMMRELDRKQNALIRGVAPGDIRALIATHQPVRSWTVSAIQNELGQVSRPQENYEAQQLEVQSASFINPPTQQTIQFSVVMIDWSAMIGKSMTQVADYAAMRTLAKTRPVSGSGPIDTILALFDDKAVPPAEMSGADLAYLQALYKLPGNRYDYIQAGSISKKVQNATQVVP